MGCFSTLHMFQGRAWAAGLWRRKGGREQDLCPPQLPEQPLSSEVNLSLHFPFPWLWLKIWRSKIFWVFWVEQNVSLAQDSLFFWLLKKEGKEFLDNELIPLFPPPPLFLFSFFLVLATQLKISIISTVTGTLPNCCSFWLAIQYNFMDLLSRQIQPRLFGFCKQHFAILYGSSWFLGAER